MKTKTTKTEMRTAIEIIEWFDSVDVKVAKVVADLPAGYYCRIERDSLGRWDVKTKNGTKPSIRYYTFSALSEAYAFGIRWAQRQRRAIASGAALCYALDRHFSIGDRVEVEPTRYCPETRGEVVGFQSGGQYHMAGEFVTVRFESGEEMTIAPNYVKKIEG